MAKQFKDITKAIEEMQKLKNENMARLQERIFKRALQNMSDEELDALLSLDRRAKVEIYVDGRPLLEAAKKSPGQDIEKPHQEIPRQPESQATGNMDTGRMFL